MARLPNAETIALRELENGILLAAYENFAAPSVITRATLAVGAMDEPPEFSGLASLTGSMLSRGTVAHDYDRLNETIEAVGASVGTSGRTHTSAGSARSLAEDFAPMLALLVEMLRHPTFPEEQFARVKQQRLTSLREQLTNTRAVADLLFYHTAYPEGHPYHLSSAGTPESVEGIEVEQLAAFHRAHYGPSGALFVVVGAVPAEQALDTMERQLADWTPLVPPAAPRRAPDVAWPESRVRRRRALPEKSQSDLMVGLPTIPRDHEDFRALQLANTVLGVFGMMGRIGKAVRDREGMAYYARSGVEATSGPSAWVASAGVSPENEERAIELILDEWQRLREEPVPQEELEDSQTLISGSLPLRLETNGGVARAIVDMLYYDLGLDYLERYEERLRAIDAAEVRRVSERYFDPERAVVAIAGP